MTKGKLTVLKPLRPEAECQSEVALSSFEIAVSWSPIANELQKNYKRSGDRLRSIGYRLLSIGYSEGPWFAGV